MIDIQRREGHFISQDEGHKNGEGQDIDLSPCEIFYQSWMQPNPRGTLVITHGMSEHSDCYAETAMTLSQLGWNVFAWDLRGHGRSEGARGYVENFHFFNRDLACFLRFIDSKQYLKGPLGLIGHSMGGLITILHLLNGEKLSPAASLVSLSSPLLGIAIPVPPIKDFVARLLGGIMPSLTMGNEIMHENLSRDPDVVASYKRDPLRHGKISPALYLGMIDAMNEAMAKASLIRQPILIQAAGHDRIVSLEKIREFFEKIEAPAKNLIVYEESYHEIFNDLDRKTAFRDLGLFLEQILKGRKTS